jgi:hypothetical protein
VTEFVAIDAETIELIKKQKGGDGTKVINLIKSIEKAAEENSNDPFLYIREGVVTGRGLLAVGDDNDQDARGRGGVIEAMLRLSQ